MEIGCKDGGDGVEEGRSMGGDGEIEKRGRCENGKEKIGV
jgi:hypothetical protein